MPDYRLEITQEAREYITTIGRTTFQDNYALVLADLHAIGGVIVPEVQAIEQMVDNAHFREIFPRGYHSYPFPVFIDSQMEREGYLPDHMLIDYTKTYEGKRLVFKNPDFEN